MSTMSLTRSRVQLALLLTLPLALSGCAASLGLWAWDEWFRDEDTALYRVFVDGYDVGSTPSPQGILNPSGMSEGDYLITVANHPTKRRGLHALVHVVPPLSVSLLERRPPDRQW